MRPRGGSSKKSRHSHPASDSPQDLGFSTHPPPSTHKSKAKNKVGAHGNTPIGSPTRSQGARHVNHLSSLRLPHRAGLEPRSSLYQSPADRPPSEVASCFPAESRQLGERAGAAAPGRGRSLAPRLPVGLRALHPAAALVRDPVLPPTARDGLQEAGGRLCRIRAAPSIYPRGGSRGRRQKPTHTYWPDIATPAEARAPPAPGLRGWRRSGHMTLGKQSYLKQDVKRKKKKRKTNNCWKSEQLCDLATSRASHPVMDLNAPGI